MKKYDLFKVLLCVLLVVLIGTYFIPGSDGTVVYLGIGEVVINSMQSFYYFYDITLFIILVGGLYGILNKTPAYKKFLDTIVSKVKPKSINFVIGSIITFAVITALTSISMPLFIFVPFVISIILLLGYDKLVAISSTIGAIVIGLFGCIFLSVRESNYSTFSMATLEQLLDVEKYTNILPKVFLLVIGIGLLIWYVLNHIKATKDKKVKYDLNDDDDVMIVEVKGNNKKVKIWPIVTCFSLLFILLILGLVPWNLLHGIDIFENFYNWVLGIKIGNFELFSNLISSRIPPFGMWGYLGNFTMVNLALILVMLILKIITNIKFDDVLDGFIDGAKKIFMPAIITTLAYSVLICTFNTGFFQGVIDWGIGLTNGFNLIIVTIISLLGNFLHVDIFYTSQGVFLPILAAIEDTSAYPVLDIIFQSTHALIMLFGPTSLILVAGLSYLKVPYKTWLKYIYRLVIMLFIVSIIVSMLLLVI